MQIARPNTINGASLTRGEALRNADNSLIIELITSKCVASLG